MSLIFYLFFINLCYNNNMKRVIVAISTPLGKGAISIVRMSGSGSLDIAKKVFMSKAFLCGEVKPRFMYFGQFLFADGTKENCLMVYFKAPFSYTGEDIIEFQIHGGTVLSQKVLSTLLDNGAVMAEPGEFTRQAFENGKVSLDEAESIIGEINAESESELRATLNLAEGKLKEKIRILQNSLTESIAQIEATLDYPEEDFEKSAKDKIFTNLQEVKRKVEEFIKDSQNARYITNGINIAIVGSPNVGKSSLLNALIGEERAIVTDIEGTTRDVLNESISYQGVKFNFIDTAGIRESEDKVEKIGIEKSKKAINNADVVLFVLDGSRKMNEYDKQIKDLLKDKTNLITIVNKSDVKREVEKQENEIVISALKDDNVGLVKEKIFSFVINEEIDYSKTIIINERQISILKECEKILNEIDSSKDESMDIIAMLIKKLWNELGKITGECENERIIDLIFSKFCLGK